MCAACRPIFSSTRSTSQPGDVVSTRKAPMPLLPARRVDRREDDGQPAAWSALVMKFFAPFSTQPSPSRRAVVRSPAGVRAHAGLREREAAEPLAACELRQIAAALLLGARREDRPARPATRAPSSTRPWHRTRPTPPRPPARRTRGRSPRRRTSRARSTPSAPRSPEPGQISRGKRAVRSFSAATGLIRA